MGLGASGSAPFVTMSRSTSLSTSAVLPQKRTGWCGFWALANCLCLLLPEVRVVLSMIYRPGAVGFWCSGTLFFDA